MKDAALKKLKVVKEPANRSLTPALAAARDSGVVGGNQPMDRKLELAPKAADLLKDTVSGGSVSSYAPETDDEDEEEIRKRREIIRKGKKGKKQGASTKNKEKPVGRMSALTMNEHVREVNSGNVNWLGGRVGGSIVVTSPAPPKKRKSFSSTSGPSNAPPSKKK